LQKRRGRRRRWLAGEAHQFDFVRDFMARKAMVMGSAEQDRTPVPQRGNGLEGEGEALSMPMRPVRRPRR